MTKIDRLIGPAQDQIKIIHRKGDTDDIIQVVLSTLTHKTGMMSRT